MIPGPDDEHEAGCGAPRCPKCRSTDLYTARTDFAVVFGYICEECQYSGLPRRFESTADTCDQIARARAEAKAAYREET